MAEHDDLTAFPRTLRASTEEPTRLYRRVADLVAIHGGGPAPRGWEVVLTLADPPIRVCRGAGAALPRARPGVVVTPVYALAPRGGPAVPTGLVLVRFRGGVAAAGCGEVLARVGFAIHEILPYAPDAAWVKAVAGDIPAALRAIPALEALPEVVNVEPQMVREPARR